MLIVNRILKAVSPLSKVPTGQRVRGVCAVMGLLGAIFAYQCAMGLMFLGQKFLPVDTSHLTVELSNTGFTVNIVIIIITLAAIWWCGYYIKKHDTPGPDGWGQPVINKAEALEHPDIVWAVRKLHASGCMREGETVYFTTIRDIMASGGVKVTATQIRSALQAAGCFVRRDTIKEDVLAKLFREMERAENADDDYVVIDEAERIAEKYDHNS